MNFRPRPAGRQRGGHDRPAAQRLFPAQLAADGAPADPRYLDLHAGQLCRALLRRGPLPGMEIYELYTHGQELGQ